MADAGHVHPDLVGPAVFDPAGQECSRRPVRSLRARQHPVEGPGRFPVRRTDHSVGAGRLPSDRKIHDALFVGKVSFRQGKVY